MGTNARRLRANGAGMKYQDKTFSVAVGSEAYRESWARMFAPAKSVEACDQRGGDSSARQALQGIPVQASSPPSCAEEGTVDRAPGDPEPN
jgi:hypothetical protein